MLDNLSQRIDLDADFDSGSFSKNLSRSSLSLSLSDLLRKIVRFCGFRSSEIGGHLEYGFCVIENSVAPRTTSSHPVSYPVLSQSLRNGLTTSTVRISGFALPSSHLRLFSEPLAGSRPASPTAVTRN